MGSEGDAFRAVLGRFCSGIVIVTSCIDGEPVGLTAQSFAAVSLAPPMVLFCPAKTSTSWPKIRSAGRFCVNVLSDEQREVAATFAVSGADKFAAIQWEWSTDGLPMIDSSLAYIECSLDQIHDAGDHEIAIGLVTKLLPGHPVRPLLYYQSNYHQLLHAGNQ